VSGVCCAGSEIPKTAVNASKTANLLENTSHAPLSPMKIPFTRSRSSIIHGPKKAAVLNAPGYSRLAPLDVIQPGRVTQGHWASF
jgi:hypothetical protein